MPTEPKTRPRLLDLYCRAGGAGMGYSRAGFEVVGVDIEPIDDYPFEFHQSDAIEYVRAHGNEFDAVHASPPCQPHSALTKGTNKGRTYTDYIKETRLALWALNKPFIIENVQGAPIRRDVVLCGEMFGLNVIRHRYFEVHGFPSEQPVHIPHRGRVRGWRHGRYFDGPYLAVHGDGGGKGTVAEWQTAMGIDWTSDRKNLAEAIPPAYTEFIGRQLLSVCR
ncbi:hypothetical protein [Microbacterium terrisoli]|uniref:hypothetical protein n=1 Tax=Microbacterium terrisoli TaxID=3242192 RepID=UPI0028051429|nr:hypothetical protein [Microbacterium protaetiae]